MAVVSVEPIESKERVGDDFHIDYESVYEVITNAKTDGPITARQSVGIPAYREPYRWFGDVNNWAFCNGLETSLREVDKTKKVWRIKVTHSTRATSRDNTPRENPLDEPPELSGSFVEGSRIVYKDKDGAFIRNSAGQQFVGGLEQPEGYDTLSYKVNTATIDLALRASLANKVNSAALWGLPARCVWFKQWQWVVRYFGNEDFVANTMEFYIRPANDPWNEELLDEGDWHYVDAGGGVPAVDADGNRVLRSFVDPTDLRQVRGLLDGNGFPGNAAAPVTLTKKILREADLTQAPIENPLPGPFV